MQNWFFKLRRGYCSLVDKFFVCFPPRDNWKLCAPNGNRKNRQSWFLVNSVHKVDFNILWVCEPCYSFPVGSQGLRWNHQREIFLQTLLIRNILKPTGFTVGEHAVGLLVKTSLAVMNQEVIFLHTAVETSKNKIAYIVGQHYFSGLLPTSETVLQL